MSIKSYMLKLNEELVIEEAIIDVLCKKRWNVNQRIALFISTEYYYSLLRSLGKCILFCERRIGKQRLQGALFNINYKDILVCQDDILTKNDVIIIEHSSNKKEPLCTSVTEIY